MWFAFVPHSVFLLNSTSLGIFISFLWKGVGDIQSGFPGGFPVASSGPAVSQPLSLHRQCCGADKGTVWNQIAQPQIRLCLSLAV